MFKRFQYSLRKLSSLPAQIFSIRRKIHLFAPTDYWRDFVFSFAIVIRSRVSSSFRLREMSLFVSILIFLPAKFLNIRLPISIVISESLEIVIHLTNLCLHEYLLAFQACKTFHLSLVVYFIVIELLKPIADPSEPTKILFSAEYGPRSLEK